MYGDTSIPYATEVAIFLVASVLIVPLFQFLRVSPILGFLLAGVIVGPSVLKLTSNAVGVATLAKFGVVFLLFTIGLELSFERLKAMRRYVFGLGVCQVIVSAAVIAAIAFYWGNTVGASLIIGFALALSSTAIVLQLLVERGAITRRHGRTSFAVLLFQDLAVVPILILVNVVATSEESNLALDLTLALAKAVFAVAAIIILGRVIVHHMFRIVAATRIPETFIAMTLLVILGVAWVTDRAGLSMELGAFLVGLLLSETEYRHQVESDIAPFKGLLLGLFFISVGMGLDFSVVGGNVYWIVPSVIGLVVLKAVVAVGLCLFFGLQRDVAVRSGLLIAAGGEFAFVIFAEAMRGGLLDASVAQFMIFVASFSMLTTPGLAVLGDWLGRVVGPKAQRLGPVGAELEDVVGHVIVAGFGRVGQTVAEMLARERIAYVAIDIDATRIWRSRQRGLPAYFGDVTRPDVLVKVGALHASVVLLTLEGRDAARRAVLALQSVRKKLPIIARASDPAHAKELHELGAKYVILETLEASLQLAGLVLRELGTNRETVSKLIERTRDEQYEGIDDWRSLTSHGDPPAPPAPPDKDGTDDA